MSSIFKSVMIILVSVAIVFASIGCSKEETTVSIGISKIIQHPALDAIEQGIIDGLAELGYEDIVFDLQNANGDITTATSIAQKFKADKVDLAIGIATPTAQALANIISDSPVLFSAVTEPIEAGLVENYDHGIGNVTGVSDLTPVEAQIRLLAEVTNIKRLGHVYTSGEANAVLLAEMAEKVCKELGIEFVPSAVTNSSEVKQAAQAIASRVDGFYVSNDNTVVSALPSLADVAMQAGVPIMSADTTSAVGTDVMLAWGFDYYKLGKATALMAAEVLEGADPSTIPVGFMTDPSDIELRVNLDVAAQLGITIADSILDQAAVIVKDGKDISQ